MKFPIFALLLLIASLIFSSLILFRNTHHKFTKYLIIIVSLIDIIVSIFLFKSIRSFESYHSYNFVQWWLFFNLIVNSFIIPFGIIKHIIKHCFSKIWKKNKQRIKLIISIFCLLPTILLSYGATFGRSDLEIKHIDIEYETLPDNFDGYRIALFADTHLGSFNGDTSLVALAFDSIQHNNPDLIVFGGDLINNFLEETRNWENTFKILNAPKKFAIRGNHDTSIYYDYKSPEEKRDSTDKILNKIKELGFDVLQNNYRCLTRGNDTIVVCGTDDGSYPIHLQKDSAFYHQHFCIWLVHSAEFIEWGMNLFPRNFKLTLAGHTHGGQIGLRTDNFAFSVASFKYDYDVGLFEYYGKYAYVNAGLGVNGLPLRLGVSPEVSIITLHKKS